MSGQGSEMIRCFHQLGMLRFLGSDCHYLFKCLHSGECNDHRGEVIRKAGSNTSETVLRQIHMLIHVYPKHLQVLFEKSRIIT